MNNTWQALAREAGVAAEQMAIGITALSRANYAQQAYYGQAFFALSIGFERAAKLAFIVDHVLENRGDFPPYSSLKNQGHHLHRLLDISDKIAERHGLTIENIRLPRTLIHNGIIQVLSDFASNITRYYNLDLVTMAPRVAEVSDPIRAWYDKVVTPVLEKHCDAQRQKKYQRNAEIIDALLGPSSVVQFHSERGDEMNTIYKASLQTGMTEFAKPYVRMYVLQLVRFLAQLLSELSYMSHKAMLDAIPHLGEFFAIFDNSDNYFKKRKTWSIYRP